MQDDQDRAGSYLDFTVDLHIVPTSTPFTLSLDSPPAGPLNAPYLIWIWRGDSGLQTPLVVGGEVLGCTANPTPLDAGLSPGPVFCLRGGLPSLVCGSVRQKPSPATTPWSITPGQGLGVPTTVTLQGLVKDDGAVNSTGFSVTNAVILEVQ